MKRKFLCFLFYITLLWTCKKEAPMTAGEAPDTPLENGEALTIYTEISGVSYGIYDKQNPYGLYGEIVIEIQKQIGDETEIKIVPWARAYEDCLQNCNVILFPMNRTPEREDLFLWVGPLMDVRYSLYAENE
ncbi:MAG TPA: hypothetical protein P5519_08315 [Spirochaetia bacterium]|nr:hypothetical protein [Spirochaetales bacterium]HQK35919.1 hypothetical protein [Spirochaetales bacterium]HRS65878.1 hypothetical protein [Spirochaetia bacterium]